MATIRATIRALSILVSARSVISAVQSLLDIGLIPSFEAIVTFYRGLAASVFGLPAALFGFRLPQPIVDFWTVSFIGAGAYVRTPGIEQCRAFRTLPLDPDSIWWKVIVFLVFGFSGLGIAMVFNSVSPFTYVDGFYEESMNLGRGTAKNVLLVCAGAIAFFAANAYSLSK
jgi:hypothetical protein